MVSLEDVSFSYQGSPETIRGVSLRVRRGECCVLLGGSGSGKTTIIRLINGLAGGYYRGMATGKVLLNGQAAGDLIPWQRSQLVGSVFQDPSSQFFSSQLAGEVAFGCENLGFENEAVVRDTDEAIALLGLDCLRDRRIDLLSSGQKQKIAVASALAPHPLILVMDEPSANLDEGSSFRLGTTLRLLKERGFTLIIAEHRIAYLMDVADSFYQVDTGSIRKSLTPRDVLCLSADERLTMGIRCPNRVEKPLLKTPAVTLPAASDASGRIGTTVEVAGLSLSYGRKRVLADVSFSLSGGQILALTGENGAGKTSLARVLAGLRKAEGGSIAINGKRLGCRDLRREVWYSSNDTDAGFFTASVADEVMLGIERNDENLAHARSVLELLGLYELKERHPAALSGGQKQRLSIACGLVSRRPVIILDEPTSGLDSINMTKLARALEFAADQGRVIMVATHDHEFMEACCGWEFALGRR